MSKQAEGLNPGLWTMQANPRKSYVPAALQPGNACPQYASTPILQHSITPTPATHRFEVEDFAKDVLHPFRSAYQKQKTKNVPVGIFNPLANLGDALGLCPHSIQQRHHYMRKGTMRKGTIGAFIVLAVFLAGSRLLADEVPLEQLPRVVLETIDMEKGDGTAKSADSYIWGNTTIYKIEIDLNGAPELELQVAENGKLIRVDRLQQEMDDDQE